MYPAFLVRSASGVGESASGSALAQGSSAHALRRASTKQSASCWRRLAKSSARISKTAKAHLCRSNLLHHRGREAPSFLPSTCAREKVKLCLSWRFVAAPRIRQAKAKRETGGSTESVLVEGDARSRSRLRSRRPPRRARHNPASTKEGSCFCPHSEILAPTY